MATIKQVAELAKVSIGTVSNVLNGKTQNEELIQRVEQAMEQLAYRPDAIARSLKNTRTMIIGVVLPNILDPDCTNFLYEIEHQLRGLGYSILVKFSRHNSHIEYSCIESCLDQGCDGIIIYSYTKLKQLSFSYTIPTVLIGHDDILDFGGNRILLSYEMALEAALSDFQRQGKSKICFIISKDLAQNNKLLKIYHGFFPGQELVAVVGNDQEWGFQAFFEKYALHPEIDAIIAGSNRLAMGAKQAMKTLNVEHLPMVAIKESRWIEDEGCFAGQISISQKRIAQIAVEKLINAIERPKVHEAIAVTVEAEYDKILSLEVGIQQGRHPLRFAMFDCPSSKSLQMLSKIYQKKSKQEIVFDLLPYQNLEEMLHQHSESKNSYYDGFMIDITWFEGLVESGYVQNLDALYAQHSAYFDDFIDGILQEYGMYIESLYSIPFMSGAQLLFYQKDLFESPILQRQFRNTYGEELAPPCTWSQFILVAEFFTQKYTPRSPVQYGISIPQGINGFTTIGFLMRLWSYGSDLFGENREVILNNSNSVAALRNLITSYRYTSGSNIQTWNDAAEQFMSGQSAMVILYDSDARNINNYTKSKVAGNIGYSLVPGGTPVLGGWSLGLNQYGKNPEEAKRFLLWACGRQNGIPLSLLGGSTLHKEYFSRADLENIEPWKALIQPSYKQSKKRFVPDLLEGSNRKNYIYTTIISSEIDRVLQGKCTEQQAIERMTEKIKDYIAL